MKHSILLVGGDARQRVLARLLAGRHRVGTLDVPGLPDTPEGPWELLVLPCPVLDRQGRFRARIPLAQALALAPGAPVLGGAVPPLPENREAVDLLQQEQTARENAALTALAVPEFLAQAGLGPKDRCCLVIGWGRIGRVLAPVLLGAGAEVRVVTRRPEAHSEIRAMGAEPLGPEAVTDEFDLLLNTAPGPALPPALLDSLGPDRVWVELASPPGGLGSCSPRMKILPAAGLPGRLPEQAGAVLYRAAERWMETWEARI